MAQRNDYQRLGLGQRMSEEFQLLAEEKWIVETLAKLKKQRNCLQIERLHLESLKAKLKPGSIRSSIPTFSQVQVQVQEQQMASTSAVNLMQNASVKSGAAQNEFGEKKLDDATCNEEELNLFVTNPVFDQNLNTDFNMEEDEESDDNDMFIDMNMLMNGVFK